MPGFPHLKILTDVALGELESARAICEKWRNVALDTDDPLGQILKSLCPLLEAHDQVGLARQLHAWEEYTVKQLGLEKIWEPTPFPIEVG